MRSSKPSGEAESWDSGLKVKLVAVKLNVKTPPALTVHAVVSLADILDTVSIEFLARTVH